MTVELIYLPGCPNVAQARANLLRAFAASGRPARWAEWDNTDESTPAHLLGYGSPTILVDGRDVEGGPSANGGSACRLYGHHAAYDGAPSVERIAATLLCSEQPATADAMRSRRWPASLAPLPGIAFAAMPKLACPACWPAYSGLLSAVGLSGLIDTTYLLVFTAVFLAVAVGALAWGAAARRGYAPLATGIAASVSVLGGKFAYESDAAMYIGVAALIGASIWNVWPVRSAAAECLGCGSRSPSNA